METEVAMSQPLLWWNALKKGGVDKRKTHVDTEHHNRGSNLSEPQPQIAA